MVREIVINGDAIDHTAHFHTTPHALEFFQRGDGCFDFDARAARGKDGSQRVFGDV